MNTRLRKRGRRGSALLIVLGFLSFMMVSAVSFAIYMRIERQASSNYRHSMTARHMLNAALYRAIDEIDSELRIEKVSSEGDVRSRKFPDWPGRTKPSAVPNGLDNGEEARVLSLESLGFIPGLFVNDVRRCAVSNQNDNVNGVSANRSSYLGAKWRPLSMPVFTIAGGEKAYENAVVGRYAYVCVNLSDMLDVNVCKAGVRDAVTNRVSIGHLFGSLPTAESARNSFDQYIESTARRFETLQDFYACMYEKNDPIFSSPYHDYLKGDVYTANKPDAGFEEAGHHILVTDSFAKAQPANATACNILLQPPIAPADLTTPQKASVRFLNTQIPNGKYMRIGFQSAIQKLFAGRLPPGSDSCRDDVLPMMLADYIDEDHIPKALNMPCVEQVPMVSQIMIGPFFKPRIMERDDPASPAPPAPRRKIFSLNPVPLTGPDSMQVQVEVCWPYKFLRDKTSPSSSSYSVEVLAYLKVHSGPKLSNGFNEQPSLANGYLRMIGSAQVPDFSGKSDDNQNECFKPVSVTLRASGGSSGIDFVNSDGTALVSGFNAAGPVKASLIIFARIKQGSLYVDSAPEILPFPGAGGVSEDNQFLITVNKLFFQTADIPFDPRTVVIAGNGMELSYDYTSLEIPDPRFNYKAKNWILNTLDGGAIPMNGISPKTLALLGQQGRDGDVFISVGNTGRLLSPGELGFLLRPFRYNLGTDDGIDFRTRIDVNPNSPVSDDSEAYFRTIRLYDHSNSADPSTDLIRLAKDPIYNNFTAQNVDGSVPGARVNPLSDFYLALTAAIEQTPGDYWFATRDSNNSSERTRMQNNSFNKYLSAADWRNVTNAWVQCMFRLRTLNLPNADGKKMSTTWQRGLPDYYGNYNTFGWYSGGFASAQTLFAPSGYTALGVPATLTKPLHEIDRKMLYSFSLDAFSDRQQLFLYFLRAEVTVPSFGSSQDSSVKSLAGGRAVALVWRDPYPEGYEKEDNSWTLGNWYGSTPQRISPWYQVNIRRYNDSYEPMQNDPSLQRVESPNGRFNGYHQHKILYFKQLDN